MSISASAAASRRLAPCWSKQILYVDRGIVVLNKPSGLICQSGQNDHSVQPVREHPSLFLSKKNFSDSFAYVVIVQ